MRRICRSKTSVDEDVIVLIEKIRRDRMELLRPRRISVKVIGSVLHIETDSMVRFSDSVEEELVRHWSYQAVILSLSSSFECPSSIRHSSSIGYDM